MPPNIVTAVKDKLSHINTGTWHWRATHYIWGYKARGKACSYYWWKLPLSLIALTFLTIIVAIYLGFRALGVTSAWFLGYRFKGKITNESDAVLDSYNYERTETGKIKRSKFAPWPLVVIPILLYVAWFLVIARPAVGRIILVATLGISATVVITYLITKWWKNPAIQRARTNVRDFWDRVCPTLVVDDTSSYGSD